MKSQQDFKYFYDKNLSKTLLEFEDKRKNLSPFKQSGFSLILFSLSFVLAGLYLLGFRDFSIYFLFVFIFLLPFYYKYQKSIKIFKLSYKIKIIRQIIKFFDRDYMYEPEEFIPIDEFYKSDIFRIPKNSIIYKGSDKIIGSSERTKFTLSWLEVFDRDTKVNNKELKIHKGIFFKADFNKNFEGKTFVLPDIAETFLGSFGTKLQSLNPVRPPLVKMENPEFEKYFVVYSTDQIESRYLLSTNLIEKITDIRKKINKNIAISFIDSNIYLAIPFEENILNPKLRLGLANYGQAQEYFSYFDFLFGLIEILNLNVRIWT